MFPLLVSSVVAWPRAQSTSQRINCKCWSFFAVKGGLSVFLPCTSWKCYLFWFFSSRKKLPTIRSKFSIQKYFPLFVGHNLRWIDWSISFSYLHWLCPGVRCAAQSQMSPGADIWLLYWRLWSERWETFGVLVVTLVFFFFSFLPERLS